MSDAMLALVIAEARPALDGFRGDVREALRKAMAAARNHWMVLDEPTQFRGAVGAVMEHYGQESEEWKRLAWEVQQIARFSAALNAASAGVSVDFGTVLEETPPYEPLGLMGLWRESK